MVRTRTAALAAGLGGLLLAGCGTAAPAAGPGQVAVVAAENQYGSVAAQIGGRYVSVTSIERNPDVDPHEYEVTAGVASTVSAAQIVIQNGLGYDGWIDDVEAASPSASRTVLVAQHVLGLPDDTPNPHLWYLPATMPAVARALTVELVKLQPDHAPYFERNEHRFLASLAPWQRAIAQFRLLHGSVAVATTEPVADYLLEAMGVDNLTPWSLQADIMNGVDPSPQDISLQQGLLSAHNVKALVYNQQVVDPLTESFIATANAAHVPVVGVYETMPKGYDYQDWMLAEVEAVGRAVTTGASATVL